MNSHHHKVRFVANLLIQLVLLGLFLAFSVYLIARANGYLLNRQTLQIEQTGIINVTVQPTPVTVTLNGIEKTYPRSPINLSYLKPGFYVLQVAKAGYVSWHKSFDIAANQVASNPFVTLFLAEGHTQAASPNQVEQLQQFLQSPQTYTDLDIRANEIWITPILRTYPFTQSGGAFEFVARFSEPVYGAKWFSGTGRVHTHVLFQIGNEIHIMDRDGTNDIVLAHLQSSNPTDFMIDSTNKILIYKDGTQILQRQIEE